jgi:very-short-patch-repair endonuclease
VAPLRSAAQEHSRVAPSDLPCKNTAAWPPSHPPPDNPGGGVDDFKQPERVPARLEAMRRRRYSKKRPFSERGATENKIGFARELRANYTEAEQALWASLRHRQLGGWRWRRQHIVAGYIVDFYCPALRLAVEVDGEIHAAQRGRDASRDRDLLTLGCVVLRVRNREVLAGVQTVANRILALCLRIADPSPRIVAHRSPEM